MSSAFVNLKTSFDVAVVGGGPAGSCAARRLALAGASVLLIERLPERLPRFGEFLSGAFRSRIRSNNWLEIGWESSHLPVHEFITVWGTPEPWVKNFIFDPYGHGLSLNRSVFNGQFVDFAISAGVTLASESHLKSYEYKNGNWKLIIKGNEIFHSLSASYLIFATGRESAAPRKLAPQRNIVDRLTCWGFRCNGYLGDPRPAVEATPNGWLYSIGLPMGKLLTGYFTDSDMLPDSFSLRSLGAFKKQIKDTIIHTARLEGVCEGSFFVTTAASECSADLYGHGWCLVGDAAKSLDPLSSSGIPEALEGAELVSQCLITSPTFPNVDLTEYQRSVSMSFEKYLNSRHEYYCREKRWINHVFWQRRKE